MRKKTRSRSTNGTGCPFTTVHQRGLVPAANRKHGPKKECTENIRNRSVDDRKKRNQQQSNHHQNKNVVQNTFWCWSLMVVFVLCCNVVESLDLLPDQCVQTNCNTGLQKIVNDWIAGDASVTNKYGHIKDWNMSQVTSLNYLFRNKMSFNADISKWDVSNVTSMVNSK